MCCFQMKWLGLLFGLGANGLQGGLIGFLIGAVIDHVASSNSASTDDTFWGNSSDSGRTSYGTSGGYDYASSTAQSDPLLHHVVVTSLAVMSADKRIMHSEMDAFRDLLQRQFGADKVSEGEELLRTLHERHKQMSAMTVQVELANSCMYLRMHLTHAGATTLFAELYRIAQADRTFDNYEKAVLMAIGYKIGLSQSDIESVLGSTQETTNDAYSVLGLTRDATDDEVKKAYRKLALKYHPDRLSGLSESEKQAAVRKFQEINNAKEIIYKERGL